MLSYENIYEHNQFEHIKQEHYAVCILVVINK